MRGYVEESPEKKALVAMLHAARVYASHYLTDRFSGDDATNDLEAKARAYAEIVRPYPKPRVRKKKG